MNATNSKMQLLLIFHAVNILQLSSIQSFSSYKYIVVASYEKKLLNSNLKRRCLKIKKPSDKLFLLTIRFLKTFRFY